MSGVEMLVPASVVLIGLLWAICCQPPAAGSLRAAAKRYRPPLPIMRRADLPMRRWLDPVQLRRAALNQRRQRAHELLGKDMTNAIMSGKIGRADLDALAFAILMHPRVVSVRVELDGEEDA